MPVTQFNVSSIFDTDVIGNRVGTTTDITQTSVDSVYILPTQTLAAFLTPTSPNGLPDDGVFAANAFRPLIDLAYSNSDNGNNARLVNGTGNFTFDVPDARYDEIHIAAFSADGNSSGTFTFVYTDGTRSNVAFTVLDWITGSITESSSQYYLANQRDRISADASTSENGNNAAVFGLRFLNPDPTKTIASVEIAKTNTGSKLMFLGSTGVVYPTVNLSVSSTAGSEAGTTQITVTATASEAVVGNKTVNLGVTGSGITTADYTLSSPTITIPSGQTSGSVTFTVQDDVLKEGAEVATLTLSAPSAGLTLGNTISQTINIADNDLSAVQFDVSSAFNVDAVINRVGTVNDTTQDAIDVNGNVLVTQSYANAALPSSPNGIPDNGFFAANAFHPDIDLQYDNTNNGNNARLLQGTGGFNVAVTPGTYSEIHLAGFATEGTTTATLVFRYSDGTTAQSTAVTVRDWFDSITESADQYYLVDGTDRAATDGSTYANDNAAAIFGFRFVNPSPSKTLTSLDIVKTSASGNFVFMGAAGVLSNFVNLSVSSATGTEAGTTQITVTATTTRAVTSNQTVPLNVSGTGITTGDYTLSNSVITIPNGQTSGFVTFTVQNDAIAEGTEIATLTMGNPSAGLILGTTTSRTVSITDNDTAGVTIIQSGGNTAVTEGGATDSYTVVLNSQPTANVTIALAPNGQLTTDVTQLVFTPQNWNIAQTVTVTAANDAIVEGNHTGTIAHTTTSTDTNYNTLSLGSVTAAITDNDTAGITITQSGGNTTVAEGGTTDSYTVVLNSQPTANVTIALAPNGQLTTDVTQLIFTPQNWNIAQTVTVTAANDTTTEGNHTGTIAHTTTSTDTAYNNLSLGSVTASITDNDTAGITITQSGGDTTVVEGGATDAYTVVLNSQPTANVTIALAPNGQLTTDRTQLVFTPQNWNIAQTVTVTAANDAIAEGNHTGTIAHTTTSTDTNYNTLNLGEVTATIIDNDLPGVTITQSDGNIAVTEGGSTDTYAVVLNTQPTADVTINLTPDGQLTTDRTQLVFTPQNWNIAQTVTVTAANDTTTEGNHTGTIAHTTTSTDTNYNTLSIGSVTASITDNDNPPNGITLTNSVLNENVAPNTVVGTLATVDPDGGSFSYSLVSGTGDTDNGAFQINGANLEIRNSPNFEAQSSYSVLVRTTDNSGLTFDQPFTVTINNQNDAPILLDTAVNLNAIRPNAGSPSGAVGTLVSQLVGSNTSATGQKNVTDQDAGAQLGIAVTAANITNGSWFFSTNNGTNWNPLGAVTDTNALLLAADANTRLYFQANTNFTGQIADAITFHAWDQTTGSNGSTANVSLAGGSTAFSTAKDLAALQVAKSTTSDFNNDGNTDLFWRNKAAGVNFIWTMEGTNFVQNSSILNVASNWDIVGLADFSGDGKTDILWRDNNQGATLFWTMEGDQYVSTTSLRTMSTNWEVLGVGDFSSDGKTDIYWRDRTTGYTGFWIMDGGEITTGANSLNVNTSWEVGGVGDFNGDGENDILWNNRQSGDTGIWLMQDTNFVEYVALPQIQTSWYVAGVGDFNRDNQADIVWRDNNSGIVGAWLMEGTKLSAYAQVNPTVAANTGWDIA